MSEAFLHYIWQFQYFDKSSLVTTVGEPVHVFTTGNKNTHAGPDFFNARVKLGVIEWSGSVEIHINSGGWYDHKHEDDDAYENVILHVVWKDDNPVIRKDGTRLPTVELNSRVHEKLILDYTRLVNDPTKIPCAPSFTSVNDITKFSMLDKALSQRLELKATRVAEMVKRNNGDWDETCYQLLCRTFGFKINEEPFLQLALSLPYKILLKHADKLIQIEALLFGHAGFLDEYYNGDTYYNLLQREYSLLSQKYQLHARKLHKTQWKLLRLRPANFPTIRLAQLAALIHDQKNIFSKIAETDSPIALRKVFTIQQSDYWQHHFQFFKPSASVIAALGEDSINNIIINTVVPLLVAYGNANDDQTFMDRSIDILQQVQAENNSITRLWRDLNLKSETAFDSQAQIELYNNFCVKRKCLECNIGYALIKPTSL